MALGLGGTEAKRDKRMQECQVPAEHLTKQLMLGNRALIYLTTGSPSRNKGDERDKGRRQRKFLSLLLRKQHDWKLSLSACKKKMPHGKHIGQTGSARKVTKLRCH